MKHQIGDLLLSGTGELGQIVGMSKENIKLTYNRKNLVSYRVHWFRADTHFNYGEETILIYRRFFQRYKETGVRWI